MGHRWLIHATVLLVSLLVIVRAIVVNMQSSDVVEVANTLHVMADNTSLKEEEVQVDPKGYIMFCPCMGRFGNQMSQYIGALAFAKGLDRTLVLPPFVKYRPMTGGSERVPFTDYFDLTTIKSYHKVITMEMFMKELAPVVWPPGHRAGYCYGNGGGCPRMKEGNPFGPFWDHFNIDFDAHHNYQLNYDTLNIPRNAEQWYTRFPVAEHPVIALAGAPGSFPVAEYNRHLQHYFKWSQSVTSLANNFIQEHIGDGPYVGIHLRMGSDWVRACDMLKDGNSRMTNMMESPQCLGYRGKLTYDICYPSREAILQQTADTVEKLQAKAVFVASDSDLMLDSLQHKCKVVTRQPPDAQVDLAILSQSDHFIGNCVSSFTAIVKRDRNVNNKPSSFWNYS
ncbi:GDP-fucose protein O-fucosyltransferase 1-like isoform X2 [Dysidea avara]|uniref:GDP-fucose protein O-fucosyltransferase 1-like isoform X2 n=1 Tax=Dysidea avara TaxID=196820 RepID=UPI003327DE3E